MITAIGVGKTIPALINITEKGSIGTALFKRNISDIRNNAFIQSYPAM
jgi:hypothetical protein